MIFGDKQSNWFSKKNVKAKTDIRKLKTREQISGFFTIVVLVMFISLIFKVFNFVYSIIITVTSKSFLLHFLGVLIILFAGIALFVFRRRNRYYYGIAEISFALASGWFAISKITESGFAESIALVAAVYLVVRGMDNILKGLDERQGVTRNFDYSHRDRI